MPDPLTTITLALVAGASLLMTLASIGRLVGVLRSTGIRRVEGWLLAVCTAVLAGLLVYRMAAVHRAAPPLRSHVDGLLLVAALCGGTILFLDRRSRLPGVRAFGLPLVTFLSAWAVCASAWTYVPFDFRVATMGQVWRSVHLVGVYAGTFCVALAGIAGSMYLVADARLRHKRQPARFGPLASLEAIERLIIRASAVGFALLTLGLISGWVVMAEEPVGWSPGPWYTVKIVLSVLAWVIYALLMNLRHAAMFRGRRAAWLSIFGLVLLVATFSLVTALPADRVAARKADNANAYSQPAASSESALPAGEGD